MANLFTYGTLMCEDIMRDVSGELPLSERGVLRGYIRWRIKDEHYPALVPHATGAVEGVVYRDIPESAWLNLDRFEGEMYARTIVAVELDKGEILEAATYVMRPEFTGLIERTTWDFDEFVASHKTQFELEYRGFSNIKQ